MSRDRMVRRAVHNQRCMNYPCVKPSVFTINDNAIIRTHHHLCEDCTINMFEDVPADIFAKVIRGILQRDDILVALGAAGIDIQITEQEPAPILVPGPPKSDIAIDVDREKLFNDTAYLEEIRANCENPEYKDKLTSMFENDIDLIELLFEQQSDSTGETSALAEPGKQFQATGDGTAENPYTVQPVPAANEKKDEQKEAPKTYSASKNPPKKAAKPAAKGTQKRSRGK